MSDSLSLSLSLSGVCQVDIHLHELMPCRSIQTPCRRQAEISGRRSYSTILNQVCLGLPVLQCQSLGGSQTQAWRAWQWSWLVLAWQRSHWKVAKERQVPSTD